MSQLERPPATDPTFWGLLVTQFLGAFNDNVFKFLVMFLCTDRAMANPLDDWQGYALIAFGSPFILFSGVCGYLADRYSLTELRPLACFGQWRETYPEIQCGKKRGFTYFAHQSGEGFSDTSDFTRSMRN